MKNKIAIGMFSVTPCMLDTTIRTVSNFIYVSLFLGHRVHRVSNTFNIKTYSSDTLYTYTTVISLRYVIYLLYSEGYLRYTR